MKAFLSHSSLDKEFVQEVADRLGRVNCVFDKYSFETGMELYDLIVRHLGNSSVFVFFATKQALQSDWCDFELKSARGLEIQRKIRRCLVYVIGDGIGIDEIPSWLQKSLISYEKAPAAIARDISHHLKDATEDYQRPLFLGRTKERELIEDIVNPIDGRKKPKSFALFGLPGIGRRALIKSCVSQLFSLSKTVEIYVEPGDDANSICIKLADKIEPYSCQEELKAIIAKIEKLTEQEAIARSLSNIERLVNAGELLLFVDTGGCLNDNGTLKVYMNRLLEESERYRDAYYVFILTRRISSDNQMQVNCVPVDPLSNKSTGQLLSQLGDRMGFSMTPPQISELTDYINGYPPSAWYAAKQASTYGVPALISDKRTLIQFSKKRFLSHIKEQKINDADKSVLRVLSMYSPLPLDAILILYQNESGDPHDRIYGLIDCALLRVVDGQNYYISDPIKSSVRDVLGTSSNAELNQVLPALMSHIDNIESEQKLEFSRVLYRIDFALKGTSTAARGIKLRADFIKLVEQAYHQQRYNEAVELGYEAIKECPSDTSVRTYLIKALIQEERWGAAQEQIEDLYPTDELRNVCFLRGFMYRKMGKTRDAIDAFQKAELHGRKGVSLQRELAHCYIMLDDVDSARKHIVKALSLQPDNPHLIDMAAKLEIKFGDERTASVYLDKLELIDEPKHYNMRLSAFHYRFGRYEAALEFSRRAVSEGGAKFFSGRVQHIKTLIALKDFDSAQSEISGLDAEWANQKNDVKIALRCSLALASGDYTTGYALVDKFAVPSSSQAKGYRKKFCELLVTQVTIPFAQREKYQSDLEVLSDVGDVMEIDP